jgi:FlaA1/EpsC-like NDP-sugar epimerase
MMRDVLILGAGGTGSDVLQWLQDINAHAASFRCLGFLDDDPAKWQTEIGGSRVLGPVTEAGQWPDVWFRECAWESLELSPACRPGHWHPA